ncbi:MAG: hydroxyisourate hydrolase [Deltaproteobacteria bacterium]|nr:hydroxyisourate hydrolase [Deltaproteobacteria bacterium]
MPPSLSTHVLDTAHGIPAEGVHLVVEVLGREWQTVAEGRTNADGRCPGLLPEGRFGPGRWRIRFDVGPYFAARGQPCFFPYAEIVFDVADLSRHHHVPLLVSPFGYSTYRGS